MIGKVVKPTPSHFSSKARLLEEMDYLRIDEAVVFHTLARDYSNPVGNAQLLTELEGDPRLHPCWVLPLHPDPDTRPATLIDAMRAHGVKVARLYPTFANAYDVSTAACGGLFEALEERHIPVLLTGSDLGRHPAVTPQKEPAGFSQQNIAELCARYPKLPIIIVRFNNQNMRTIFPMLEKYANLYLEISYFTTHRGVDIITQAFGGGRLLFGTGMPMTHPGVPLMLVRYAAISDEDKRLIAGDTFRRLLREVR